MAINLSDKMLSLANKNLYGNLYTLNPQKKIILIALNYFLEIKIRCKIFSINIFRKIISRVLSKRNNKFIELKIKSLLEEKSNLIKNEIETKGYIFLENFLNQDYYDFLNKNFPKKYELRKSKSPLKNYNIGYIYGNDGTYRDLENPCALNTFYKFVLSNEFEREVNNIFNLSNQKLVCKNVVTSIAEERSFLIPHMDSISAERKDFNINFIYFLDGNDDDVDYSGGTSIYQDNNGEKVLLKPKTLKNSVLIYNNTDHFFHGFKIMKKNCHRKAFSFQFNLINN